MSRVPLTGTLKGLARWGLILLVAGLPLFLGGVTPAGVLFARILALVIAGSWIAAMVIEGKLKLRRTGLEVPLGLFFLLAVGLSFKSVYRQAGFTALAEWSIYAVAFLAAVNLFGKSAWLRRLAIVVIAVGTGLSGLGLLQYAGVLGHAWWSSPALSASYVNKNHFAGLLVMLIPLTLGFCIATEDFGKRLLFSYLLALQGVALFFSFSKAGWISLMVSLGVLGLCLRYLAGGYRRGVMLFFTAAAMFSVLAILLWQPMADYLLGEAGREITRGWLGLALRVKLWGIAGRIFFEHPYLGSGPGSFPLVAPGYRPAGLDHLLDYTHNDLLQLSVELGGGGLLLAGYGVVTFFRRSLWYLQNQTDRNWGLRWGAMGGVLALALHSLVEFQFHIPANAVLCFVLAGLVASGWRADEVSS